MLPSGDRHVSFEQIRVLPHRDPAPPAIGHLARLVARVRVRALDGALIAGADPATSAALSARAARLTSARFRDCIAEGLERLVREAQRPRRRWWALEHRKAILANARELHALAGELHSRR